MIRNFDSPEQALNSYIKAAQEWISKGMPMNPCFSHDRSLCTTLDYYVSLNAGRPFYIDRNPFDRSDSVYVRKIKRLMTKRFIELDLDSVFPFNTIDGDNDSYLEESDNKEIWKNKGRIDFVMNFKFLEEPKNGQ